MSIRAGRLIRARFVIDVKDCGLGSVRYLPSLREATRIGQLYFPDVTASVTVVRAPPVVGFVYSLVKAFMPIDMQMKISILGDDFEEGLKAQSGLDMSHLPVYIGGKLDLT
ncbi:unnamed protein product [Prorocentrum cordatum]|uniref:CRAL-TRIO domain-containing protein n=1 Tax=Prorocentrum cordatum TaxID=2364126 RepID=A0ABN9REI5_9DINO|nr:unnamed protein product [Polarella glacialis]